MTIRPIAFSALAFSISAFAMGGSSPSVPAPTAAPVAPVPMASHPLVEARSVNFEVAALRDLPLISPQCLSNAGVELVAIDPGHDDSAASQRSDARVRGESENRFLWPKIHEGNLTQVTSWLVYDYLMKQPNLSSADRAKLQTMIRFSRHPGEKTFAQYEKEAGYMDRTLGTITQKVENRKNRVDVMMREHRKFDSSRTNGWSGSKSDVRSRAVEISVHANSTTYFDEGDFSWVIIPKDTSSSSPTYSFAKGMAAGLSDSLTAAYTVASGDSPEQQKLKDGARPSAALSKIKIAEHDTSLAMLSPTLGNSSTRKVLIEGIVMNGKAGHLANIDITEEDPTMKLEFWHNGAQVASYGYARIYRAYAEGIVRGLAASFKCGQ